MYRDTALQTHHISSSSSPSSSSFLYMQCEQLLAYLSNRTTIQSTPNSLLELLTTQNLTLHTIKTIEGCVTELQRVLNTSMETNMSNRKSLSQYEISQRPNSLLIFIYLIILVSLISIAGNLCLAKVLYTKRFRLSQTDRIVLCLAISELCLVLIDSPTEIYRFLTYSFSLTWLCRFHTFFESFFSTCIIFYHLLGAFDRFVYIHGHTYTKVSTWSIWCRRISTKTGSIILLILPVLFSLPIAICNLLHANVIHTPFKMKICLVQYADRFLISILLTFYILPLLFAFFLHAKLIYFIRSRNTQHYIATKSNYLSSTNRNNTTDSQYVSQRKQRSQNFTHNNTREQLLLPNKMSRKVVMFNTNGNTAGTIMTTTTGGQVIGTNNSSNSSASSRSSTGTGYSSLTSPIILYKINLQANANAKRTVLLLVLLLSFYVLCWAPYNIFSWRYAYQIAHVNQTEIFVNRSVSMDSSLTSSSSIIEDIQRNLRRFIFINYSLYLLSMVSMCFSFIFYFSLNKQARAEFSNFITCVCPQWNETHSEEQKRQKTQEQRNGLRCLYYNARYQHPYPPNNINLPPILNNKRVRTMRFNTHPMIVPPMSPLFHGDDDKARTNSLRPKLETNSSKRAMFTYGRHVQRCP
ncbi:hypothetical protein I4U23_021391 [Adineta vaga]|nr:hypothetical protein I4U23_021391 [Adineta vaga]